MSQSEFPEPLMQQDRNHRSVSFVCMPGTYHRAANTAEVAQWKDRLRVLLNNNEALHRAQHVIVGADDNAHVLALELLELRPLPLHTNWHTIGRERINWIDLNNVLFDAASFLEVNPDGQHAIMLVYAGLLRRADRAFGTLEPKPFDVVHYGIHSGRLVNRRHLKHEKQQHALAT